MQKTRPHCFSPGLSSRQAVATRLLTSALGGERMAHAILLTGRAISDKWLLSRQLAAFLNCTSPTKEEAGSCLLPYIHGEDELGDNQAKEPDEKAFSLACQNCRWLYRDEHPKAWTVLSRDAGKSGKIPVESARNLSEELARSSQYLRVVIIDDASDSAFHRPAANALLKTIEEPRSGCLFILFAQCEEDVLQTIVSRCQLIPLNNLFHENVGHLAALSPSLKERMKRSGGEELNEMAKTLRSEIFYTTAPNKRIQTKDALVFAHQLGELFEDDNFEAGFDLLITLEIEHLEGIYRTNLHYSRYLEKLFQLVEEAKRQWDHYVTKKGVCESFVLSWLELRQNLVR